MSAHTLDPAIDRFAREARRRGPDGRFPRSKSPGVKVSAVLTPEQFAQLTRLFPMSFSGPAVATTAGPAGAEAGADPEAGGAGS